MRGRTQDDSAAPEAAGRGFDRQDKAWFGFAVAGLILVALIFGVALVAIWPRAVAPALTGTDGLPSGYSEDHRAYERDLAVLDARLRAADARIASIGTLTAAVGIGFGALITVVVIFFALRNRESAIAAARDGVEEKWPELERRITKKADAEIEKLSARVRVLERNVRVAEDKVKFLDPERSLTPKEARDVAERAERARLIPANDRRAGDWLAMIENALKQGNYPEGYHAACSMLAVADTPLDKARALMGKGVMLGGLGQTEAEIAVFDDLIERYGNATKPELLEQVAGALLNKGAKLGTIGQTEAALTAFDDILHRFGNATEPALREQVARAMLNKGIAMGKLDRREAEIATYDHLLARFGETTERKLFEPMARALVNKGNTLRQLGRTDAAIAAFDDLLARFGDATTPILREAVARAYIGKAEVIKTTDIAAACAAAREARRRLESLDTEDADGLRRSVQDFLTENCPDQD